MTTTPRSSSTRSRRAHRWPRGLLALTVAVLSVGLTSTPATPVTPTAQAADQDPAASAARPGDTARRGDLLATAKRRSLSPDEARRYLRRAGFSAAHVRRGVVAHRLVYRTVDTQGRPTRASGLLVQPRGRRADLTPVVHGHGTATYRPDAPSVTSFDNSFVLGPGVSYGSAGFAAVLPDYLGLGRGTGRHPWLDSPSAGTASMDMLRAAREFLGRTDQTLRRRVLATGFSQGASVALELGRVLQDGRSPYFRLRALAPISGAYDFERVELPYLLSGRLDPRSSVAYTTLMLTAWNALHGLYDDPREVLRAPYAGRADRLFDGTTPGPEMLAQLPDTLDELLTGRGWRLLRHPGPRLLGALRIADGVCKDWSPRVPLRLYRADRDEQAATANTRSCAVSLRSRGVAAPIVDLGRSNYQGSRHLGSAVAGTDRVVRWFLRLTRAE